MSAIFKIDYKRLLVMLLPTLLRKPILFGMLNATIRPIITMYDAFMAYRKQNLYTVNQTGQVCYLRGLLNDSFDPDLRRISITNGVRGDWHFFYMQSTFNIKENGVPFWLGNADTSKNGTFDNAILNFKSDNTGVIAISKQGSIAASGFDFTINVPMSLRGMVDENRIKSLVNNYKLASKRYNIQYF